MQISQIIQDALLQAFGDHPFLILREAGLVAHLRSALIDRLEEINIQIDGVGARSRFYHQGISTISLPVHLEIKITEQYPQKKDDGKYRKTVDIAVLRENARVICERGGAGDVIASINYKDVYAAIEVKSSPSTNEQINNYLSDIESLLKFLALMENDKNTSREAHFVLVDKKLQFFGTRPPPSIHNPWKILGEHNGIFIEKNSPELSRFVHVHVLQDINENGKMRAGYAHYYAFRK